jgi:hypothetical protein
MGRTKRSRHEEVEHYFNHCEDPDRYPITEALRNKVELWMTMAMLYIRNQGHQDKTFKPYEIQKMPKSTFLYNLQCAMEVFAYDNGVVKAFWQQFALQQILLGLQMAVEATDYKAIGRLVAELRKNTGFDKLVEESPDLFEAIKGVNLYLDKPELLPITKQEIDSNKKRLTQFLNEYQEKHAITIPYEYSKG